MKLKFLFAILLFCCLSYGQSNEKITTIETVEILNDNSEEAIYYFKSNWKQLRIKAIEKGYIHSFQFLKTTYSDETPFHLVLITTYSDKAQYDKREAYFSELIKEKGTLKLLNEKEPSEFRKSVFAVEGANHLE
ncbi:hypothetical protein [Winogradskyella ouciana]|uniref:hypothetical protein n=1 Tax=Winogradskyella ouciana TaxID=2608631 RepID=UPI003D283F2F